MDDWLRAARDETARLADIPADRLDLDADTEVAILELARIAAHESGARTNAPLICYLAGRAGVSPAALLERLEP